MRAVAFAALTWLAGGGEPPLDGRAVPLSVAVGKTVEREVGIALGIHCDDLEVVKPEIKTKSATMNVFRASGLKKGRTTCRVGTTDDRPSFLFDVTVTEK